MLWFRHLSASSRDEKLLQVLDEFGPEGYGLFWLILEKIAEKMSPTVEPEISISLKNLARFCGISAKKLKTFLFFLKRISLFEIEMPKNGNNLALIKCSNLVKYRDEYVKRRSRKK